jgi:phosphodiester glycosidase
VASALELPLVRPQVEPVPALGGAPPSRCRSARRSSRSAWSHACSSPVNLTRITRGRHSKRERWVVDVRIVKPPGRDDLIVEVDGRQPRWSVGLSFSESADVLRSLGARQGMNLDGGGSSAMTVAGRLISRPSDDTGERPVGGGLFVVP